jgi:hypothetical protein
VKAEEGVAAFELLHVDALDIVDAGVDGTGAGQMVVVVSATMGGSVDGMEIAETALIGSGKAIIVELASWKEEQ